MPDSQTSKLSGFPHPEGDDVPLVDPKLEDGGLPQYVHQLPLSTGFQVTLWVFRYLLKGQGWTDPHIPYCEREKHNERGKS